MADLRIHDFDKDEHIRVRGVAAETTDGSIKAVVTDACAAVTGLTPAERALARQLAEGGDRTLGWVLSQALRVGLSQLQADRP